MVDHNWQPHDCVDVGRIVVGLFLMPHTSSLQVFVSLFLLEK